MMDYNYFKIIRYKGISSPLEISLKNKTIPIIGVNECGKTTILKAIFAFDYFNDKMNKGLHLQDVTNLYNPYGEKDAIIEAGISLDVNTFKDIVQKLQDTEKQKNSTEVLSDDGYRKILENCPKNLTIQRKLNGTKRYLIIDDLFCNENINFVHKLCEELIRYLPHIVYFDDFNDSIPQVITVSTAPTESLDSWSEIVNNLFKKTDKSLSVLGLKEMDENTRKSAIADVEKKLEDTITHNWTGMKLEKDKDASNLGFSIEYKDVGNSIELQIKVKEQSEGKPRFFNIHQRSKGFYWFFNFVMKMSFNPKSEIRDDGKVIFLLDEPGSYLHVSAQKVLCQKLTSDNTLKAHSVIYCTHSHNLLDPRYVELPSIKICGKEKDGNVKLFTLYEYASLNDCKTHALEPIYDVLGMNENFLEGIKNRVVLVEGITDFYSFDMFKDDNISFIPFTNAKNVNYFVPIFLSAGRKFLCLRDGDGEGKKAQQELVEIFGEDINKISFTLKDIDNNIKDIEDLYDNTEYEAIKKKIEYNGKKKKFISRIFFDSQKSDFIKDMAKTKEAFKKLIDILDTKFI